MKNLKQVLQSVKDLINTPVCKKCGGYCKPSKAFDNTFVEFMDFPDSKLGDKGNTMSKEGKAVLIDCLKCEKCGHSFIPNKI